MADVANNMDDLEDGEIESDGEETVEVNDEVSMKNQIVAGFDEQATKDKSDQNSYYVKSGKKKKSKSHKGESQFKEKSKKSRKYSLQTEDDHIGKIEKAIRKALNKNDEELNDDDVEDRRKHKKRKKYDKEGSSKKRKRQDVADEVDETEMMCVRGASPIQKTHVEDTQDDDQESYASESSDESDGRQQHRSQRKRPQQKDRSKSKQSERRRGLISAHPMQDPDGVCLYFMQGKCHKGNECVYSHDAQPPRKMELCKFYLMDCCAKRNNCLYMHAEFPCKYYHTGLPCIYKDDCKFAHGGPLTDGLKNILLKHIESAPKEILGDFPRLNREGSLKMINSTQAKLIAQYSENNENSEKPIPSLFELNIPNPHNTNVDYSYNNDKQQNKVSPKVRQSRWQNEVLNNFNNSPVNVSSNSNVLCIKNLTGVLTPRQISDLTKMGIDNLDQLGQLTVLQLNSIGISLKQITEIQLNTMSIQKLGLINATEQHTAPLIVSSAKDLDLRVSPVVPVPSNVTTTDVLGKDVDMRFQTSVKLPPSEEISDKNVKSDVPSNKDMIDIDQYTKDALKFVSMDKENIDISNECFENKPDVALENKDVDHRVVPFSNDNSINSIIKEDIKLTKECDTDIRFLQPEPMFKSPEKKHRRSTTDDEDNNLLIDEKWYSSDEEKNTKRKSPSASPQPQSHAQKSPTFNMEQSTVLSSFVDFSKIAITEEVTKLINSMKNNLQDTKPESSLEILSSPKSRDPRSSRRSPDKTGELNKPTSTKRPPRVSIYECIEGEPTDGRRRTDVDLRQADFKLPAFGDTDLRQSSSGDIDFRFSLPFKAIPNYTPASEIDGSINSHRPIPFKLVPIDIPRPDYTDIRNSTAKSQALVDPRLRKVFRLSLEESNSDSEKTKSIITPVVVAPRVDPRRKPKESTEPTPQDQKSNSIDIQTILQNSIWFRELSSTQKILVNQHLAPVTQLIKQFQQERTPGKLFDLTSIQNNGMVCNIFTNLGISLGENGEFSYLPKPKEALLKTPVNFNQNSNSFGIINPGNIDPSNINNMMNLPSMGIPGGVPGMNTMNINRGHGFNQSFSDPRAGPTPGLLGIAPNIPHNFNNFGGLNNFGNNMPFNGPGQGNDFNFENDQNFPRFPNRGGHRGRGNDRWNRGGSRGNRERKNFNDRNNWKNDRH